MKPFLVPIAALAFAATAYAQTIPVKLELGRHAGVDQFGQACTLDVTGDEAFEGFTFRTAGFEYDVWLGSPQTATPGTLVHKTPLALEGYESGRLIYKGDRKSRDGEPGLQTNFEIRYKDGRPDSVRMTKISKGPAGERKSVENCNNLRK